jgi:hypothetical protein
MDDAGLAEGGDNHAVDFRQSVTSAEKLTAGAGNEA